MDAVKTRMTAKEYLAAYSETTQPTELIDGEVIVSPSPADLHQAIAGMIYFQIMSAVLPETLGEARFAPLDVYLTDSFVAQPDVFYVANDNPHCRKEGIYWVGAPDLCVEIVSPGSGKRDRVTKFEQYQQSGVREYWIVDAEERFIEVWTLAGDQFQLHGKYAEGNQFTSTVLPALTITVSEIFPASNA